MNKKRKSKVFSKHPSVPAQKINQSQTAKVIQHQFSGPIPPPEILQQYDQVISGAAERILAVAEKDAEHQREIEKSAIQFASREVKRGQWCGLAIGISAFITSIVALVLGSEQTASILGGTTVIGLVAVFVTGRIKQPK